MSKGHRRHLKGAPVGLLRDNLTIKINNESNGL